MLIKRHSFGYLIILYVSVYKYISRHAASYDDIDTKIPHHDQLIDWLIILLGQGLATRPR